MPVSLHIGRLKSIQPLKLVKLPFYIETTKQKTRLLKSTDWFCSSYFDIHVK